MRRFKTASILVAVLQLTFLSASAAGQQSRSAGPFVSGRVLPAVMLSPSPGDTVIAQGDVSATVISVARDRVLVRLSGPSQSAFARVRIKLLMRTNARYQLRVTVSSAASPSIAASVRDLSPTGPAVAASAMHGIAGLKSAADLSPDSITLVEGPRISTGAPSSPRNAIEVEVLLEVAPGPPSQWWADVLFTIQAGS